MGDDAYFAMPRPRVQILIAPHALSVEVAFTPPDSNSLPSHSFLQLLQLGVSGEFTSLIYEIKGG